MTSIVSLLLVLIALNSLPVNGDSQAANTLRGTPGIWLWCPPFSDSSLSALRGLRFCMYNVRALLWTPIQFYKHSVICLGGNADGISGSIATTSPPSFVSLVRLCLSILIVLGVNMLYGWQVTSFEIPGSIVLSSPLKINISA